MTATRLFGSRELLPRPCRLAIIIPASLRDPSSLDDRYWASIFEALREKNVSLLVLKPRYFIPLAKSAGRTIKVVSPRFLASLIRARPKFILSTEYGLHTLLALLAARFSRSATLIFKEHADCAKISRTRLHYRRLLTSLATATIANTEEARQEVESLLESDSRRIYSVPFLVPPLINRMTEADLKLSPPGKRPIFLFAGRLISGKNVATLLEASSTLRQEGLVFSVVIAGDGPHLSVLVQTVHDLHLEDTVTFSGRVPYNSIGHLYARCDVFVMPSFTDYRSVAVLEAMRFGKPIIDSSGDGNAGNAVLDGVNGFVFDPADIDALACAMSHFIHRPGLIGKMGPRSAELVVDRTPASAADALRRVLIEITQRSAPGLQHDVMVPFREQK